MSTRSDSWATPRWFFDQLNEEFRFTLDAAANQENAKCANYYNRKCNGLTQDWSGTVFCNPPYGKETYEWVRKAWEASRGGATVVLLLPAWTDRQWFHDFCMLGEVRFIRGRLEFLKRDERKHLPWGVMVVIFRPGRMPGVLGYSLPSKSAQSVQSADGAS